MYCLHLNVVPMHMHGDSSPHDLKSIFVDSLCYTAFLGNFFLFYWFFACILRILILCFERFYVCPCVSS